MKVDVIINVYGKPWQTLCTLKSLLKHSGEHIDKIYFIKEKEQPFDENIDWLFDYFQNLVVFEPYQYTFLVKSLDYKNENERYKVRYQYGIEKSDKNFVFVTHNDVLYTGDIIGGMLNSIGDAIGIGEIGQCWNCPAKFVGKCSGEKFYDWNPTYEEVLQLPLPHVRTHAHLIDKSNPKPLPECRLNEWSCLLNRNILIKETQPIGSAPLFGQKGLDAGTPWFKEMYLKGYKFVDYRKDFHHMFWAGSGGFQVQKNLELYQKTEKIAKEYYLENLQ